MRHLIQICNLATGSKVVSWTGALNSQLQLRDLRNHCVRIYAQLAPLKDKISGRVVHGGKEEKGGGESEEYRN